MDPFMPGSYTPGEVKALVAPLVGLDEPAQVQGVMLMVLDQDGQLRVNSNLAEPIDRVNFLLNAIQAEMNHNFIPITLCTDESCDVAPVPHHMTEDCPGCQNFDS